MGSCICLASSVGCIFIAAARPLRPFAGFTHQTIASAPGRRAIAALDRATASCSYYSSLAFSLAFSLSRSLTRSLFVSLACARALSVYHSLVLARSLSISLSIYLSGSWPASEAAHTTPHRVRLVQGLGSVCLVRETLQTFPYASVLGPRAV